MNKKNIINIASIILIVFSAFSLLMVSIMAFANPQSVMDLVQVKLPNTDSYSSIRGIYGGVGMVIVIQLIYLLIKDRKKGLAFLSLLWGFYALSRLITILADGPLGSFGTQWLQTETVLCVLCVVVCFLYSKTRSVLPGHAKH